MFKVRKSLVLDFVILMICPLPFYERYVCSWVLLEENIPQDDTEIVVRHFMSDFFLFFMFFRLIFLFKSLFNYSIYNDAYFKQLCRQYGFNPNTRFSVKCYMKLRPEKTIFTLLLSTILILSYLYRIFELPLAEFVFIGKNAPGTYFTHIFNTWYVTIITMTTVGYGDLHPNTKPGKFIMMFTCLWGAFTISLMVLSVSSIFDLKKNQLLALRHIRLTQSAAKTITRAF